ncbi:MAG: asparaginase [Thermoanaerobacteraceae bacterium]|nr:asparaginase [Thermoanaerobacteraceae bacterium]
MEKLVSVYRGSLEESSHFGHISIVNLNTGVVYGLGNTGHVTYIRSAAKPLQLLPLLLDALDEYFGFTDEELAVMCGSHGGETIHRNAVSGILQKIGLSPDYLQCGIHCPFSRDEAKKLRAAGKQPTTLHNNCSGKHAAMLSLCVRYGWDLETYLHPDHPVQKRMRETVAYMSGMAADQLVIGVDGCGVPVFGLPLTNMARAYARLTNPQNLGAGYQAACRKVCQVMTEHPDMIGVTNALDHSVIETLRGSLVAKIGAEAVYCMGLPGKGIGIAFKVIDGSQRAVAPVVISILKQLGMLSPADLEQLQRFARPVLKNHNGDIIGHLEAAFKLPQPAPSRP